MARHTKVLKTFSLLGVKHRSNLLQNSSYYGIRAIYSKNVSSHSVDTSQNSNQQEFKFVAVAAAALSGMLGKSQRMLHANNVRLLHSFPSVHLFHRTNVRLNQLLLPGQSSLNIFSYVRLVQYVSLHRQPFPQKHYFSLFFSFNFKI